jgi:hypothetical protein
VKAGDGAVGVGCEKDKMVLGAVRGEGELWFLSGVWLREKEMALGSCGVAGWLWFPKDERPKREKGPFQMAGGPWLSSSGRTKAKDPRGRRLLR